MRLECRGRRRECRTIGYAGVLELGAVVTEASAAGTVIGFEVSRSIGPQLHSAVFLGGVLYPLVFATAGAILAAALAAGRVGGLEGNAFDPALPV
ncbi:hypothetical protein [Haloterrigena salifodinae]|uniref:hypothetical protein n=1 Tax=Haloterrigena salifodinae TaxID=2675099 RepID=UPI000F89635D|nr:hypothetical protein [Haloterrigena salifodinae]